MEIRLGILKKQKFHLPWEPAISLLDIYLQHINSATLFILADVAFFRFPVISPSITPDVLVREVHQPNCLKTEAVSIFLDEMQPKR